MGGNKRIRDNQAHTWPAPMARGIQRLPWRDGAGGRTPEGRLCLGVAQTESWDSACWFVYFGVSHPHTEKAERSGVGFDLISCLWVSLGIPPSLPPSLPPHPITSPRPSPPSPPWKQTALSTLSREDANQEFPFSGDKPLVGTSQIPWAGVNAEAKRRLFTWKRKLFRVRCKARAPDTLAAQALRLKE